MKRTHTLSLRIQSERVKERETEGEGGSRGSGVLSGGSFPGGKVVTACRRAVK